MGGGKRNFSRPSNRLAREKSPVAIDARPRNRFVVGHVRRPRRDRIAALRAFKQPNLHGFDRIEHFRTALGEQVGKSGRDARADQSRAILGHELFVKTELLRAEGIVRQMGIQIEIVGPQPQRGAQDDLIKYSRRCIDDQFCAAGRADDGPEIPRIRFDHSDVLFLPRKRCARSGSRSPHQTVCPWRSSN